MTLQDYVIAHTERGECKCGRCADVGNKPDPIGHTADTMFFKVAKHGEPDADTFTKLARAHRGEFNSVDPFDGNEHSYIELGGWIGDQGLALMFMGLGSLLGVFQLLTPQTLMPFLDDETKRQMAGMGMVAVKLAQKAA